MSPAVRDLCARGDLGLAPHYPTLWSAVVGVEADRVFEFGAGGSTAVILDALPRDGCVLYSCSTDKRGSYCDRFGFIELPPPEGRWGHMQCLSEALPEAMAGWGEVPFTEDWHPFDLVLHDGSHTSAVVAADLQWILPQVRTFGLVLVHDTQYETCGGEMRLAVQAALGRTAMDHEMVFSHTTLPYGAGLTIIRVESGGPGEPLVPRLKKAGDRFGTVPARL